MIDRSSRSKLAQAARALAIGQITNHEFESRVPRSDDPAVRDIYELGFWPLYDDFDTQRFSGNNALGAEGRALVSRCVLFLASDLPYRWPERNFGQNILSLLTLGWFGWRWRKRLATRGDLKAWPFMSEAEFAGALRAPKYLAGGRSKGRHRGA